MLEQFNDPKENAAILIPAAQAGVRFIEQEFYEKLGMTNPKENDKVLVLQPPAPPAGLLPFQSRGEAEFTTADSGKLLIGKGKGNGNGSSTQSGTGSSPAI